MSKRIKGSGACQSGLKGDVLEKCTTPKKSSSSSSFKSIKSSSIDPMKEIEEQLYENIDKLQESLVTLHKEDSNNYFSYKMKNSNTPFQNEFFITIMYSLIYIEILKNNIDYITRDKLIKLIIDNYDLLKKNNYQFTYFIDKEHKGIRYDDTAKKYFVYENVVSRIIDSFDDKKTLLKKYPKFKKVLVIITRTLNRIKKIIKLAYEYQFVPGVGAKYLEGEERFKHSIQGGKHKKH